MILQGFAMPVAQPYAVACAILDVDALATATGDARYRELAARARAWFDLRDASGRSVYDRERGRVADGVDGGRVSHRSGAESNIVAAQALIEEVGAALVAQPDRLVSIALPRISDFSGLNPD